MRGGVAGAATRRSPVLLGTCWDQEAHRARLGLSSRLTRRTSLFESVRRAMSRASSVLLALAAGAAMLLTALPTQAQSVADFYRGKTIRMIIGYGPGGGYDIYGR